MLAAFLLGLFYKPYPNDYWKIVFSAPILTCMLRTILLQTLFLYETPHYYLQHSTSDYNQRLARKALAQIYKEEEADTMYHQLREEAGKGEKEEKDSGRNLVIGCGLQVAQQLCGINAVYFYSTQIFEIITEPEYVKFYNLMIPVIGVATLLAVSPLCERLGK